MRFTTSLELDLMTQKLFYHSASKTQSILSLVEITYAVKMDGMGIIVVTIDDYQRMESKEWIINPLWREGDIDNLVLGKDEGVLRDIEVGLVVSTSKDLDESGDNWGEI
jgi:hypothetical protein